MYIYSGGGQVLPLGCILRAFARSAPSMLNPRNEESNTVFYSDLACCMNTST